jgi:hypothetical protein
MIFTALFILCLSVVSSATAFSSKMIYNIPHSGWRSPKWNWGSAVGTGHDCAKICRQAYATRPARQALIDHLLAGDCSLPSDFEEVKLVLALFWQKCAWDGSDGGRGGYGEILTYMAQAERYEVAGVVDDGTTTQDDECTLRFIADMKDRFPLLNPTDLAAKTMANLLLLLDKKDTNLDCVRRKCSGLVLQAMNFVENGP